MSFNWGQSKICRCKFYSDPNPAHSHSNITESYLNLSGWVSQNHAAVYPAGSMIFNRPGHEHAITTSLYEPVLLAYAWVGEPEDLIDYKMVFSKRGRENPTD